MPSWKKVITSGSDVAFKGITSTTAITASAISASGAISASSIKLPSGGLIDNPTTNVLRLDSPSVVNVASERGR